MEPSINLVNFPFSRLAAVVPVGGGKRGYRVLQITDLQGLSMLSSHGGDSLGLGTSQIARLASVSTDRKRKRRYSVFRKLIQKILGCLLPKEAQINFSEFLICAVGSGHSDKWRVCRYSVFLKVIQIFRGSLLPRSQASTW